MNPIWRFISRLTVLALALLPALHAQPTPTQITLSASPSTSVSTATRVTLTARVTASGVPVHPGIVLFCNANAPHCEDSAILGSAQLTTAGTASLPLRLSPNNYSIKAIFRGTPHSATPREPSTSATQLLTITGISTSAVHPVTATQSSNLYKLTANVAGFGTAPLTGAVSFFDTVRNGTPLLLGSASIDSAPASAQFSTHNLSYFPDSILQVAAGDFNGDGLEDLVALDYDGQQDINLGSSTLITLLSNGDGTFQSATVPLSTTFPPSFATGDFNGDGRLDLVIYDQLSCSVTPMVGNGNGTFTSQTATSVPSCVGGPILVADINGDGVPDLMLVGSQSFSYPAVLLGNGDGTFNLTVPASNFTTWPPTMLRDLNGDGIPDVVTTSENYTTPGIYPIQIYLGNGDGTFNLKSSVPYPHYVNSLDIADFNGNGIPDIIAANSDGTVDLLSGNGDGTFTIRPPVTLPGTIPSQITASDLNGDGREDALVLSGSTTPNALSTLKILLGNGFGAFSSQPLTQNAPVSQAFTLGDFNGDGVPDLATFLPSNSTTIDTQLGEHFKPAVIVNVPLQADTDHTLTAHYGGSTVYKPSISPPFDLLTFPNITSRLRITSTGFIYNHAANTFDATLTLTNATTSITGPIQVGFTNLATTVTLANPTVLKNEGFITIPAGLAAGKSVSIPIRFNNPLFLGITYSIVVYSGAF